VPLLTELLDFSDIYPGIYLINDAKTDVHMCVFEGVPMRIFGGNGNMQCIL
jgi:hypothetical protein